MWFNRATFTGQCTCGHSHEVHHGNIVVRPKCYHPRNMQGMLFGECEEWHEHQCPCNYYVDKGWIFIRFSRFVSKIHRKIS